MGLAAMGRQIPYPIQYRPFIEDQTIQRICHQCVHAQGGYLVSQLNKTLEECINMIDSAETNSRN